MPKKSKKDGLFKYDLENLNIRTSVLGDFEAMQQNAFEVAREFTKIWLANPANHVKEGIEVTKFFRDIYVHLLSN